MKFNDREIPALIQGKNQTKKKLKKQRHAYRNTPEDNCHANQKINEGLKK